MAVFTTGEAVALELPIARIPTRAAAFLIDLAVQLVLAWLLFVGVVILLVRLEPDSAWLDAAMLLVFVAVVAGYPITCETLLRGRTVGKLLLGLRVVRADGGPIDFRHALTRGLAGAIVDFWGLGLLGVVAVLTSLCSPRARRVGDILAGTVVVHDRARIPLPALAATPPWLHDWSQRLDLTALTEDLALPIRQYLTRHRTLTPETQAALGQALVAAVCERLRVPPPNYPPVHILGAVISERQRRTLAPLLPPRPSPPPSDLMWARPA
ncbi:RDD family protein [Nocardia sp. CDC159]|uniref:RDD family protein n=1 Tax=Nocardia pulmonis TaxID=2951408 RepID=A0A9X2J1F1_9NOCA|nr:MULTISPECIES: RDD family protein [Nocardia]MCM6776936.1 RDD family protein [Nocardia pulmonis]MCM6789360.1 RDD family protein [Nocardia sp. CDC159]